MNRPARRRSSYKNIADDQQQPQPTTTATTMDSANRKIELQSPEDLTYLINNARRAAAEHIQAAFPPVEDANGQEEDELRVRIEKLVEEVCFPSTQSPFYVFSFASAPALPTGTVWRYNHTRREEGRIG